MTIVDFARDLSDLVSKAVNAKIPADEIREAIQSELDNVEDDEEEEES